MCMTFAGAGEWKLPETQEELCSLDASPVRGMRRVLTLQMRS